MPETTDTTGIELMPKGSYTLSIEKVFKTEIGKEKGPKYPGYKWFFHVDNSDADPERTDFNLFMFKSQMGDLLKVLGCKEVKDGVFEWELTDVVGAVIDCHMAHVEVKGRLREQLIEIKPHKVSKTDDKPEKEKAWDE